MHLFPCRRERRLRMIPLLDRARRLLARSPTGGPTCLVCGNLIREDDRRVRVHAQTYAHHRCATYRMRQNRMGSERLGHIRRWPRRPYSDSG